MTGPPINVVVEQSVTERFLGSSDKTNVFAKKCNDRNWRVLLPIHQLDEIVAGGQRVQIDRKRANIMLLNNCVKHGVKFVQSWKDIFLRELDDPENLKIPFINKSRAADYFLKRKGDLTNSMINKCKAQVEAAKENFYFKDQALEGLITTTCAKKFLAGYSGPGSIAEEAFEKIKSNLHCTSTVNFKDICHSKDKFKGIRCLMMLQEITSVALAHHRKLKDDDAFNINRLAKPKRGERLDNILGSAAAYADILLTNDGTLRERCRFLKDKKLVSFQTMQLNEICQL